jgi:hypothetical protein
MCCSFKQRKPVLYISYTLCFVYIWIVLKNCSHSVYLRFSVCGMQQGMNVYCRRSVCLQFFVPPVKVPWLNCLLIFLSLGAAQNENVGSNRLVPWRSSVYLLSTNGPWTTWPIWNKLCMVGLHKMLYSQLNIGLLSQVLTSTVFKDLMNCLTWALLQILKKPDVTWYFPSH